MEIKELRIDDINENFLKDFNRYQKTDKSYKEINGKWILTDEPYENEWDDYDKKEVISELITSIKKGDFVFGIYDNDKLIAFANLKKGKFGTKNQYVRIAFLHVSYEYRNKGIGKKLFEKCINKAKEIGARKIHILADNAEDSQIFYQKSGFVDAEEIFKDENEEKHRQMEYIL